MSRLDVAPTPAELERDEDRGERIVVLVDGSPDAERALQLAIRFSLDRRALLTIAAYAPGPLLDGAADTLRIEQVLLAAQAEAEVEGVAAERHLLHGPDPLTQLRELVAPAPSRDRLVLCSPAAVAGPLRPLARIIVRTPPCSLYVLPRPPRRLDVWRARAIGWLARGITVREEHR